VHWNSEHDYDDNWDRNGGNRPQVASGVRHFLIVLDGGEVHPHSLARIGCWREDKRVVQHTAVSQLIQIKLKMLVQLNLSQQKVGLRIPSDVS
jgi:hypothetical protein